MWGWLRSENIFPLESLDTVSRRAVAAGAVNLYTGSRHSSQGRDVPMAQHVVCVSFHHSCLSMTTAPDGRKGLFWVTV